ncbi:MAG: DegT/DnrJ/EryC1/StrS family aminotransferase [Acidobacteriota bacterium]|nr:DegT/DnrJ/EryC1/StrS family aminotransferase [Acidobacteriota bacterium]
MQVPLLDLRQQHAALREELRAAVERVFESQQFVLGEDVGKLEAEVARYTGAGYAVGCGSGSDALLLALLALDIGGGDEVVTTPFTFFATGGAIARAGARPRFADIEPRTFNLDPARLGEAINGRTRAVVPVHLYGQCADMEEILNVAAQAIGAEDRGRAAGASGAAGCFSFYPTKNLGAAGEAGMVTTNDARTAERLRRLRVHGGATEYRHEEVGFNSRLDTLQAAVLRVKLPHLDAWSQARRERAARYTRLFEEAGLLECVTPPHVRPGARHIFHQYVVRVPAPRRDPLIAHLKERGVGTKVYYPVPLHLQECFASLGYKEGDFPEAERAARETLALPMFPELTEGQQAYVVETVRRFFD